MGKAKKKSKGGKRTKKQRKAEKANPVVLKKGRKHKRTEGEKKHGS